MQRRVLCKGVVVLPVQLAVCTELAARKTCIESAPDEEEEEVQVDEMVDCLIEHDKELRWALGSNHSGGKGKHEGAAVGRLEHPAHFPVGTPVLNPLQSCSVPGGNPRGYRNGDEAADGLAGPAAGVGDGC